MVSQAPEILLDDHGSTSKEADVYAYGMVSLNPWLVVLFG